MRIDRKMLFRVLYEVICKNLPSSEMPMGFIAKRIRAYVARGFISSCGNEINIEHGASISSKLKIGDRSGVGIHSVCSGDITIGNDVMMAPECVILTVNHAFSRVDIPMRKQGNQSEKPVIIGDDVWIGRRAMILPGVRIGNGAIVGAGSIVTRDVPDYAVVAGNPARIIKYRGREELS